MEVKEQIDTLRAEVVNAQRDKAGKRVRYPLSIRERVRGLRDAGLSVGRLAAELHLREGLVRSWSRGQKADAPQVFAVRADAESGGSVTRPAEVVQLRIGALTVTLEMGRA